MRSPNRRSLHTIRHPYVYPISECICQYESIWLTVHPTQLQGAGSIQSSLYKGCCCQGRKPLSTSVKVLLLCPHAHATASLAQIGASICVHSTAGTGSADFIPLILHIPLREASA